MAELVFTSGFIEDTDLVERDDKLAEILDIVALLETSPDMGSNSLPASIAERYGANVKKLVVTPFDVIYEHLPEQDEVLIYALVHQRAAR